jgi:hypothetical protein
MPPTGDGNFTEEHIMNNYKRLVTSALGVAVAAVATPVLLFFGGATAHAEKLSEQTISSECKEAGGTYNTANKGGTQFSSCTYKDNEGNKYIDYYADGEYYSTHPA